MPADPAAIAKTLGRSGRLLLVGAAGSGKSTLAGQLADLVPGLRVLAADPGQPFAGPPGAVSLCVREDGEWRVERVAGLGTLDAGRYRTPLVTACARLARDVGGPLVVDAPGLVRGVTAAELAAGLAQATGARRALAIGDDAEAVIEALVAEGVAVERVDAHPLAARGSDNVRRQRRTSAWDAWLAGATEIVVDRPVVGPSDDRTGRQAVALDEAGDTVTIGEIVREDPLTVRVPHAGVRADARSVDVHGIARLVVRDAGRDADGQLATRSADRPVPVALPDRLDVELPHALVATGALRSSFVGGLFDDPLLHVRVVNEPRSLLVDLGEPRDLSGRLAHQISDVFVTHAHMDHWSGFLWLLRRRVGCTDVCRVYGPPGLADRVQGFVDGYTWDRIGDTGPRFDVRELHGDVVVRSFVQAGLPGPRRLDDVAAPGGLLLDEPAFAVRAVALDHAGTTVLGYELAERKHWSIRKERLEARGVEAGRWVGDLKRALANGDADARIALPDGSAETARDLAAELVIERPGLRLAYATDLADTPANRAALVGLARHADALVLESSFLVADADRARATGHLTTEACAAIATAAEVRALVPFHFSARYESIPEVVYREIADGFPRVWAPRAMRSALGAAHT